MIAPDRDGIVPSIALRNDASDRGIIAPRTPAAGWATQALAAKGAISRDSVAACTHWCSNCTQRWSTPADVVVPQYLALDRLEAFQLIEYLKRTQIRLEHRFSDGRVRLAGDPVITSIISEADWITGAAYPAG